MVRKIPERDGVEVAESDTRLPVAGELARGSSAYSRLAPALALLSCVLYCVNGELLQALQTVSKTHASPLANLTMCHLGGLMFLPYFLGSCSCGTDSSGNAASTPTGQIPGGIMKGSLFFAVLLMGYNYAWLSSARHLPASLTNCVFQTSVALVCAASAVLFKEPLTKGRLVGVVFSLCGSALASGTEAGAFVLRLLSQEQTPTATLKQAEATSAPMPNDDSAAMVGVLLALAAAVGVTAYQVLFRLWYGSLKNDVTFLAYFGMCVSGWHIAFLPLVFLASAVGLETLELPHGQYAWAGTIVSAIIASIVNALYLCIVMWGSPMLLPCSTALSVPLMVGLDALLHGVFPSTIEVVGQAMVVASVVLIMQVQQPSSLKLDKRVYSGKDDCSP